ncbi:stage II sporulation protein P [Clostridium rectalis]|uniref:stage II sporulation protein P n=1 Tax=Clostridium rectalis TaxID=2040295 RepID=UPI000F62CE5A|nr:stage II sporulation protein P [Clostridium rectalis]
MDFKKLKEKHIISYWKRKRNRFKPYMLIIFVWFIVFITIPFAVKANNEEESARGDMFYVQVLNSSFPLVKATVFDEADIGENRYSFKRETLKLFGIDIYNPESLIGKEISCMKTDKDGQLTARGESTDTLFNSFKLNDKSVSKNGGDKTKDVNLPNKTVNVYEPNLKKQINKAKPEVFIYHTHTCESYKPENVSSLDPSKNICAIGDELAHQLEENYGISVIHDKTVHDANAYTQSYKRSGVTVDKYLKKYGDFKLVIDLHRDSVENKTAVTTKLNGENVAKFMFVMASKNPHFKNNMTHVNSMMNISNKLYPNFCRGILYRQHGVSFYHQNKSNNSILIEWGSHINTFDEAKNSAKYMARIIAEHMNGKK